MNFFEMPDRNEVVKNKIIQIEIGAINLEEQLSILRKAIEDGVYDPRSIVGDSVLRMEDALKKIKDAIAEIKSPEQKE